MISIGIAFLLASALIGALEFNVKLVSPTGFVPIGMPLFLGVAVVMIAAGIKQSPKSAPDSRAEWSGAPVIFALLVGVAAFLAGAGYGDLPAPALVAEYGKASFWVVSSVLAAWFAGVLLVQAELRPMRRL